MKKIILGLFLTVGVSGIALAGSVDLEKKSENSIVKNTYEISNVSNSENAEDIRSICTITITATNQYGQVVSQWQENYYVEDFDFAGCAAIGKKRVAELNAGL
ncbi:hypothetical protein [Chryseobacterium sp. Leaf394]|uniref:hypothetical protein n=1 Tax=Chryseobacterium sp. Leaf394 TaxID=1736361 RepID=UPI0006F2CB7F|nr:hypothetical protein [Chryseobacterium sp. Leaf394]KQS91788.1 hypothetical protein ASG21_04835 [Chryseobacterium sp. Leaf394]